ncbi:MAG: PAS-domain containing protein, partial [Rhodospirillales bacterium]
MSDRKRLLVLLGIMAGVAVAVAVLSIWLLYQAAFSQQRDYLSHLVQSQAMMVGSVVERYVGAGLRRDEVLASTLDRFGAASKDLEAFGETGALMLGHRAGDEIRFLFGGKRASESGDAPSVPFASNRAEPMRRAILGQSGTMIGRDFRGVQVLAAYRPVPQLDLGMVAEIDMLEIRRPFIRAGAISSAGAILIILLGTVLFRRISSPLVDHLEQAVSRLTEAQRVARLGNWERDIATGDGWWSDETYRILGLEPGTVSPTLETFLETVHPDDRDMVRTAIGDCLAGKAPYSIEYRIRGADGGERTVHARGTWRVDETGKPERISGTVQDITQRRRTEEDVRRLVTAIEGLAENFALYGPDDRMIMCNQSYRRLNSQVADATRRGVTFEEHVRAMAEKGLVPEANGREDEWLRERMERHRNPKGPFELRRQDGIWLHVREKRMSDGSIATISTDITERKRAEERLQDAIETISDGFAFYDADERLVMANSRYIVNEAMRGNIVPGRSFEEVLRAGLAASIYPDSDGREEEWLATRLAHFRDPKSILEQRQSDGRWMQIAERKTADGGTVAIFTDITQRKVAEAELERQKTLFEAVFRDVPDAMVLTDSDRNIVMCNPAMTRAFGYEADEVVGKKTDILYASVAEWERQGRIRFNLSAERRL